MIDKQCLNGVIACLLAGQLAAMSILPAGAAVSPHDANHERVKTERLGNYILLAQYNDSYSDSSPEDQTNDSGDGERDPKLAATGGFSDTVTRGVARLIVDGGKECENDTRPEYRLDCLAVNFGRIASTIERRPNYQQAGQELRRLSRKLKAIRTKYADPAAPKVTKKRRTYRAVSKANLAQANREAAAAIDETVTKLLRSAGNSEKRKTHYAQIATAVGSTKRLLRS